MAAATISSPLNDMFSADLRHAESIRKKIVLNYSIIGSVLFIGLIIEAVTWMSIAILIIALFVLVYTRWYGIPVPVFEQAYVDAVTRHIISPWHGLQIDYQSHLKVSELIAGGFIKEAPDYFSGRNLIHGQAGDTYLRISEVYMRSKDKSIFTQTSGEGQLKALVMVADLSSDEEKQENPRTYVINNDALNTLSNQISADLHSSVFAEVRNGKLYAAIIHHAGFAYLNPGITKTVYHMAPIERYEKDVNALISLAINAANVQ
ncbi:MAG TPA: hypothetical protein PK511_13320 [Chitinophagales bacterium]|nr:hypothetical protein [Chitinophagales bacterium]HMX05188.1 hypothetical protein [Chitinophagales bacterium]HMZ90484.1 hypothetical protein [Chitinophagales bacterium]HNA58835.1 hypothetical protein [Chitinophagales bacterium]HNE46901.1 hypothetical protein [Chitinophagales bacterium]